MTRVKTSLPENREFAKVLKINDVFPAGSQKRENNS